MKLPNTERGCPAGEPNEDWTAAQLLAYIRHQYKVLTAPDGKVRKAVAATDEDLAEMEAEMAALEKVAEVEATNPEHLPDWAEKPPREKITLMRDWLDDLSANDFEKARIVGHTFESLEGFRDAWDDWERQVAESERIEALKEAAGYLPGESTADVVKRRLGYDDSILREAMEKHDEETADREWDKWMEQVVILAAQDPAFARVCAENLKDANRRHLWADTIGDDDRSN